MSEKEVINEENTVENETAEATSDATENVAGETSETDDLNRQISDLKDQNLRLYAEFENFRKRTAREKIEMMSSANRELMTAILPVIDDLERAIKNLAGNEAHHEVLKGVELIYSKFSDTLKQKGLKAMEPATGHVFDVETMEAITKLPAPTPDMAGKVIDEVERGYRLGDKVLRYAKVVVADGSPE